MATKSDKGRSAVMTSSTSGEIQKIATTASTIVIAMPPLGFGLGVGWLGRRRLASGSAATGATSAELLMRCSLVWERT